MRRSVFSLLLFTALVATSAVARAELSAADLKAAQKTYVTKCAKCHKLYEPAHYNDEEWSTWMLKMKKKSKLKDAQYNNLSAYIQQTFRQNNSTSGNNKNQSK